MLQLTQKLTARNYYLNVKYVNYLRVILIPGIPNSGPIFLLPIVFR